MSNKDMHEHCCIINCFNLIVSEPSDHIVASIWKNLAVEETDEANR